MSPRSCPVPQGALLQRYVGQGASYTDCYVTDVARQVTLRDFVTAFYCTRLFRAERFVLGLALRSAIRDSDIAGLWDAGGRFAVWEVEERTPDALLLCDTTGQTRSWFAVEAAAGMATRLYFGSAVVAPQGAPLPVLARLSLPLHRVYSRALLARAAAALMHS